MLVFVRACVRACVRVYMFVCVLRSHMIECVYGVRACACVCVRVSSRREYVCDSPESLGCHLVRAAGGLAPSIC